MKMVIMSADLYHKATFLRSCKKIPLLISSFDLMIAVLLQGFVKKQVESMFKIRFKTFKKASI